MNEPTGPSRRALRTMAIVRWILLALVTALAVFAVVTQCGHSETDHAAHRENRYYCPMHPQIRSPDPGECPICHMDLVPIPESQRTPGSPAGMATSAAAPAEVTPVDLSPDEVRAAGIATVPVESATVGDRLRVPGVLSAPETGRVEVRVRAPGFVERALVRQTGVKVSAGQPLAFVYSPEIYRAQEEFLALGRWNAGAPVEGQSATSDLATAARRGLELLGLSSADIAEIQKTGQPIRAIALRAPASGYVTRTSAVLGSRADPEQVLYEISDLSTLWVIASVHERDLSAMKVGAPAEFTVSGSQGAPRSGKIDLVEPLLEEATRTARVRLVLKNAEGDLRPGQFGHVEFELPAAPGLFVPRDAVIRTGEHEYVYVATTEGHFEPRSVETGISRGGRIEIKSGVREGDRVVTRGSFMLDSESRLKASLARSPAAPGAAPAGAATGHQHDGSPSEPAR